MGKARVQVTRPVDDALADATMKVSQSHTLLSGIVESAVHPAVQASARECLEMLDEAVTDLRDVASSIRASRPR